MINFKPVFVGFPSVPGEYSFVHDMPSVGQDGLMEVPCIYDPSGNSPFKVTVGI